MAVVRARNTPPYPLIIFVILWVLSTFLAIWFYMGQSKLEDQIKQNEDQRTQAIGSDQKILADILSRRTNPQMSAIATANQEIMGLRKAIGAPDSDTVQSITDPSSGIAATTIASAAGRPGSSLLEAVRDLGSQLRTQKQVVATMTRSLDELKQQSQASKDQYDAAIKAAQKTAADFQTQNTGLLGQSSTLKDQVADQASKNEAAITQLREQSEADRREKVLQIEQLQNQLANRDHLVSTLRQQIENLNGSKVVSNVGNVPDGTIVRAAPGAGEVYISLGRRDRMVPGLTFAVYDPRLGVRTGSDKEAAGKGGIEVVDVSESESLCRITHTTVGQSIQTGDLIANPVYHADRTRTFHFVVAGDFDLDGDGVSTAAEHDRLVQMIKRWGGVVDDNVTTQTDFLVVGSRPASAADRPGGEEAASQPGSVDNVRGVTQQSYDQVIAEAKESSVPILNQNRFLAMIGYYSTTIVR